MDKPVLVVNLVVSLVVNLIVNLVVHTLSKRLDARRHHAIHAILATALDGI